MSFEVGEAVCAEHDVAEVYHHAMLCIVEDVFHVMLGAQIHTSSSESIAADDAITSFVSFEGVVDGAMWLRCSVHQARRIAGLFMGGVNLVSDEETVDVMRELASIIAGNLLKLMPHGAETGVPSIHRGRQGFMGEMLFSNIVHAGFEFNGDVFSLNFGGTGFQADRRSGLETRS